jgi:hypothetical protein
MRVRRLEKLNCVEMKHYYIILSGLFVCVFWHVQAQEHRLLRDPYAYETAVEMYATGDTLPFDNTITLLAVDISRKLERGFTLEDDVIWATLQKLEPYRKSRKVQEALKTWTERIREAERYDSAPASSTRHIDSNSLVPVLQAYRQGKFDKVIALSRELLRLKMWEGAKQAIRNNLALALMHENRDLCAQLELELLNTETEIRYFPALINLTVVYERLGKREEAEVLVNRLTEYMEKEELRMPLADFNVAWFLGEKEDYPSTDKALEMVGSKLMKKQQASKYAGYREQLAVKYKSFSVLKIGFLGKGFAGNDGRWIISFLVFIVYWIMVMMLCTGVFQRFEEVFNLSPLFVILLMLLYFALAFILAWGIPSSGGGWIGLVVLGTGSLFFVLKRVKKIRK